MTELKVPKCPDCGSKSWSYFPPPNCIWIFEEEGKAELEYPEITAGDYCYCSECGKELSEEDFDIVLELIEIKGGLK